ncbi:MAG: GerAB/ArcD/ProY family transporter [Clostridia bacterium]|nr:GerAB/ArcD/ProY family transporter [Clostridia bacterium]
MENNYKLGKVEAIAIILIVMINKLILNIPYYIVDLVGSGAIINLLYIGTIDFILLLVIIKLFKNFENSDILDVSEFLGGKILKNLIGFLCIALFFLVAFITLIDFSNVLHTIYFSNFPMVYILFFFILGVLIANIIGIKGISRTICFIVPFAIFSVIITFFTSFENLDIKDITPIIGKSYTNTFITGLSNCFSMYILVIYYFLKPLLKDVTSFKKVSIISFAISFILLMLTIVPMLTLFNTSSNSEPINSLFLLSRQIELGRFLQRIDALFIFLWIFAIFAYLSFIIFMINRIIKKIFPVSNEKMLSYSTCGILFGIALIPVNISHIHFIEDTLYRYLIIGFTFVLGIILLTLANFKKRKLQKNNIS